MEARQASVPTTISHPQEETWGTDGKLVGRVKRGDFVEETVANGRELLWGADSVMVTLLLSPSVIWIWFLFCQNSTNKLQHV